MPSNPPGQLGRARKRRALQRFVGARRLPGTLAVQDNG